MKSLKLNICMILALTSLTDAVQTSVVNKKNVGSVDELVIECDADKFSFSNSDFETISVMFVERKLDHEENYTIIGRIWPFASEKTKEIIPNGRQWSYDFRGSLEFRNKNIIQITVYINDASCSDAGLYRCGLQHERSIAFEYTEPFSVTNMVNYINHGFLTMAPTSGHSLLYSKNRVGDQIFLGCTLTGPLDLQLSWAISTKKRPVNETAYPVPKDITSFAPESTLDCNACRTYFYMSTLNFKMNAASDGNTYICSASDGKSLNSRANFTIYLE